MSGIYRTYSRSSSCSSRTTGSRTDTDRDHRYSSNQVKHRNHSPDRKHDHRDDSRNQNYKRDEFYSDENIPSRHHHHHHQQQDQRRDHNQQHDYHNQRNQHLKENHLTRDSSSNRYKHNSMDERESKRYESRSRTPNDSYYNYNYNEPKSYRNSYKNGLDCDRKLSNSYSHPTTRTDQIERDSNLSCSSLKRINDNNSNEEESPKKRSRPFRQSNANANANNNTSDCENEYENNGDGLSRVKYIRNSSRFNDYSSSENNSPSRNNNSHNQQRSKLSIASTPKTDRISSSLSHANRVKELIDKSTASIERNLSNNWADIIEELEEQTKELENYVNKISSKYNLPKDQLLKSMETDTDVLRKRQRRINFGKVTAEYQRYLQEVPRKNRKPFDPKTPNKFRKCGRRKFDGQIKKWRKLLHVWDETPHLLPEFYKNLIENNEEEQENSKSTTDEFGCTSNITGSNNSYNFDDFEINESDECDDNKLIIDPY